jgi:hypothetical protein
MRAIRVYRCRRCDQLFSVGEFDLMKESGYERMLAAHTCNESSQRGIADCVGFNKLEEENPHA